MIVTGNNDELIHSLLKSMNTQFRMKDMGEVHYFLDMGEVHYFLGIQIHYLHDGLFMNQRNMPKIF